ncbi:hypothetical protein SAMN04488490_1204 [Marinobacter sp. LV10R510-11A]|nr:hypothetical protein SAMN04488490_1204 [Marinobacter sp. LV10R510-11A]
MVKVNSLTTLRESGKSDELIVPQKQPNKGLQGPAEAVEGRGSIKRYSGPRFQDKGLSCTLS